MKVKCKKDLVSQNGSKDFTKGNTYEGKDVSLLENLTVTDDHGFQHRLGHWSKNFKIIK